MTVRNLILLACFLAPSLGVTALAADYLLVASQKSTIEKLSQQEVRAIFVGDKLFWSDGQRIFPARIGEDKVSEQFLKENVGMSLSEFNTHWRRRAFSGRAIPPRRFDSTKELLDYLNSEPGAIGLIPKSELSNATNLKTITIGQ